MTSQPIVWEQVQCSMCGSKEGTPLLQLPDRAHHVPGISTFVRCHTCGLVYLNPRPTAESFGLIYPEEYAPYQPAPVDANSLHPDMTRTCAFVHQLQPQGGRLLDIGCGPGTFLQAMRLLYSGWHLNGIEPDERAAGYARSQGLEVQTARLDTVSLPTAGFDAVTLWNVFEHLPDQKAALRTIQTLLAPGGVLYLAVPMWDSWDARIWRSYWMAWDPPRHFVLFNTSTLQQMLAAEGFTIIESACVSGAEYCFTESLRLYLNERIQRFALRRLAVATSYSRPFRLLLRPYVVLAERLKRSTVLTLAARRMP